MVKFNKSKERMDAKMVLYKPVKVYQTGQIKLDPYLLKTLGINPGDQLCVSLDMEERAIIIIKSHGEGHDV